MHPAMRKIEIVSLLLAVTAAGVLAVALQLDYGNARQWLFLLFVALLLLALDPKRPLNMIRKPEKDDEPEEEGPGYFSITSSVPVDGVDRKWLDGQDVYLLFLDKESEDYYFIHYVNGKADEVYVGDRYYLECQDFDEVFEGYETLDGLLAAADNEEIEDFCLISSDDFLNVKHTYENWQLIHGQKSSPAEEQAEPIKRVGTVLVYLLLAFTLAGLCAAVFMFFTRMFNN